MSEGTLADAVPNKIYSLRFIKIKGGGLIYFVDLSSFCTRETTFETFCLPFSTSISIWKGIYVKGKNLLPKGTKTCLLEYTSFNP